MREESRQSPDRQGTYKQYSMCLSVPSNVGKAVAPAVAADGTSAPVATGGARPAKNSITCEGVESVTVPWAIGCGIVNVPWVGLKNSIIFEADESVTFPWSVGCGNVNVPPLGLKMAAALSDCMMRMAPSTAAADGMPTPVTGSKSIVITPVKENNL